MSSQVLSVACGRKRAFWTTFVVAGLSLAVLLGFGQGWFAQEPDLVRVTPLVPKKKKWDADELRKRYAFESVSNRLEYEAALPKAGVKTVLPAETNQRLEQIERSFSPRLGWGSPGNLRVESLKLLHSKEVHDFVNRDGFGEKRMPSPQPSFLELHPAPTIPFGAVSYDETTIANEPKVALSEKAEGPVAESRMPSVDRLSDLHRTGIFNFLLPDSLGYVKDRDNVAGFEPHQFRFMPELHLPPIAKGKENKERWKMRRLELVSLLKHPRPVAYVSDELPRMEKLRKAKTRPLDGFEEQALKRLRGGQDLVTEATTNRIRMMGSLRAGKACMECHFAERGDLLGTFTYELLRDPPVRAW
jgi:hypothetical protein